MAAATSSNESSRGRQVDNELREMLSSLTHHLVGLHAAQKSSCSQEQEDNNNGVGGGGIITLAGSNVGASMLGGTEEKKGMTVEMNKDNEKEEEEESAAYYVNSNFQGINNSIMVGGSYTCNDPGVHVDVSADMADPHHGNQDIKKDKKKKEKKSNVDGGDDRSDGYSPNSEKRKKKDYGFKSQ